MIARVSGAKPIIGLAGGIGSGKSFVAARFAEMGCLVICADELVREAYGLGEVKEVLKSWWGQEMFTAVGEVDRAAVAQKVFADPAQLARLEALVHPLVAARRDAIMDQRRDDPAVKAFIWDIPLLFETGLDKRCDAVVFVDCPFEERLGRVSVTRGWDRDELLRREKAQWGLDRKRELSDYVISNTADAASVRDQVTKVLSLILAKVTG